MAMWRALRGLRVLLLAAGAAWAASTWASDLSRGRALYDGSQPLAQAADAVSVAGDSAPAQACVSCHRPSGLGNFEGGLGVPPIAGPTLFKALDRDTARFFHANARYRVRPAYDAAGLSRLLRTGVTPDGVTIHAAMPRVVIDDAQLADLVAYLRSLSATPSPGLEPDTVHLATVSTPDADPQRRDAMLATLAKFIAQKNGQSRHEARRSAQASRTHEMVMYTKFRVWRLEHWALQGPPDSWAQQLAQRQAQRPVFALVAGIGRADWAPVDAFCESAQLPCLLPLVEAGAGGADGAQPGFYGLHFHAGIDADAALAARLLRERGLTRVQLWADADAAALSARVAQRLQGAGLTVVGAAEAGTAPAQAIVSLLAPAAHAGRLQAAAGRSLPVAWLAGTHAIGQTALEAAVQGLASGWILTPMRSGSELDRQLQRSRIWMQQQGLSELPADVVASTLQATTVLGEGLAHMDFAFTREYLLELLEHGLENVIPWGPYPRMAIGPAQRIAVKQTRVGEVHEGRLVWHDEGLR
jgi:mono/diheme cytochrome c family protein